MENEPSDFIPELQLDRKLVFEAFFAKEGSVFKEPLYKFSEIASEGWILSYDSRSLNYLENDI